MKRYLIETSAPEPADLGESLWNRDFDASNVDVQLVMEQYKLYVELADRVSARRSMANTFFLSLNTAVFAAIGVLWNDPPTASPWLGMFPTAALVLQCLVWFWVIRAYRQLSAGKWAVVGAFERRLPTSPWWGAEWQALGKGEDPSRYWPITHVEQWVPFLFAMAYIGGFLTLTLS